MLIVIPMPRFYLNMAPHIKSRGLTVLHCDPPLLVPAVQPLHSVLRKNYPKVSFCDGDHPMNNGISLNSLAICTLTLHSKEHLLISSPSSYSHL